MNKQFSQTPEREVGRAPGRRTRLAVWRRLAVLAALIFAGGALLAPGAAFASTTDANGTEFSVTNGAWTSQPSVLISYEYPAWAYEYCVGGGDPSQAETAVAEGETNLPQAYGLIQGPNTISCAGQTTAPGASWVDPTYTIGYDPVTSAEIAPTLSVSNRWYTSSPTLTGTTYDTPGDTVTETCVVTDNTTGASSTFSASSIDELNDSEADPYQGPQTLVCTAVNLAGTTATSSTSFSVDSTPVSLNLADSGQWLTTSYATLTATVGASGVQSGSCTDSVNGGSAGVTTLSAVAGNPSSGAGTYQYKVGLSDGSNSLSCSLVNGASQTGLLSSSTAYYEADGTPHASATVVVQSGTASDNGWYDAQEPVQVNVSNVTSSDTPIVACTTPSGTLFMANGNSVTVPASYGASGTNVYSCIVANQAAEQAAPLTVSFNVDADTPGDTSTPLQGTQSGHSLSPTVPDAAWENATTAAAYVSVGAFVGPSGFGTGTCTVTDDDSSTYPGGVTDPDHGDSTTFTLSTSPTATTTSLVASPTGTGTVALTSTDTNVTKGGEVGTVYNFDLPLYQGENTYNCSTTAGDGEAATIPVSGNPDPTVLVDSVMPSVQFAAISGATVSNGQAWINSANGKISVTALYGASGPATPTSGGPAEDPDDDSIACMPSGSAIALGTPVATTTLDAADLTAGQLAGGFLDGVQNSYEPTGSSSVTLDCVSMNGAGIYQDTPITETVGIDTTTPVTTLSDTGAVSASADEWSTAWQSTVPSVTVEASTTGASGIAGVTCTVDGTSVTATPTATGNPVSGPGTYTYTLPVSAFSNGANSVACSSSSVAGLTSAAGTHTVNIDTEAPTIAAAGSLPSDGWQDSQTLLFNVASGPSGVQSVDCTVDGVPQTIDLGGGVTSDTIPVNLGLNAEHSVDCVATSGAGETANSGVLMVGSDTSTPSIQLTNASGQALTGADAWLSGDAHVTATAIVGPSGISQNAYTSNGVSGGLECSVDGGAAQVTGSSTETLTVSGSGSHQIVCAVTDRAAQSYTTSPVDFDVDTVTPQISLSGATFDQWVNSTQTVDVEAQAGPSNLTTPDCTVNDVPATLTSVPAGQVPAVDSAAGEQFVNEWTFPVSTAGTDAVRCDEANGAGAQVTATNTVMLTTQGAGTLTTWGSSISIDGGDNPWSNLPTTLPGAYSTTPQTVTITADPAPGAAPIVAIDCSGAAGLQGSGQFPATAANSNTVGGEQIQVTVGNPGGDLTCTATDQAGNVYPLGSHAFLVDSVAPTGQILPQSQWPAANDVSVAVSDGAQGSGVASVTVAITGHGLNDTIPASYDASLGAWVAVVDDQSIKKGSYQLAVTAADKTGNSGTVQTETIGLPLRDQTTLTLAATTTAKKAGGKSKKGKAHASKKCSSHKVGGKNTLSCASATKASTVNLIRGGALDATYGERFNLSGVLTNTTTHQVIAGATLSVEATSTTGGNTVVLKNIETDSKGAYSYALPAGESRLISVEYDGSAVALPTAADVHQQFTGDVAASLRGSLRAGRAALLSGQVKGGYIPSVGVQIDIQWQVPGLSTWSTFDAGHTNDKGRFTVHFPIGRKDAGYTYQLRVVVPSQADWPYNGATSATLTRHVAS